MRIVELLIDELEELFGFDAVALVNQPAHEAEFYAFKNDEVEDAIALQIIKKALFENMKENFVTKLPGESKDDYIARCIPAIMNEGYDQDQAAAICYSDYESFDETLDPQEIVIGDYQTRHYDMCPAATALYSKIENQEIDTDMGLAIRNAKLQDALFYLEKHTVKEMQHASFEDVKAAEILAGEIMTLARMMGLEEEHQYVLGHLQAIRELYQQGIEGSSQEFSYFDNLPDEVQEKLLERLAELGYDIKDLEEDYEILDNPKETFALPTKQSANPDLPTNDTSGNYKILYKYTVSPGKGAPIQENSRDFCRRLIALNLLFRKEDIAKMTLTGANSQEFGYYDIFEYKGSYNCRHYWKKQYVYQKRDTGLLEVAALLLDQQAREKEAVKNPQQVKQFSFATEEDQQIVVGPLMIPDKLIFRVDENGEPYYVYFTSSTIEKIARKMMREERLDDVNIEHSQEDKIDSHMLETWIVEDPEKDKQQVYGMNYPKGTWMGMYKINDPKIWAKVKSGELRAYSIEGYFADRLVQN